MTPHPYGWLSVVPPLVAIGLAIATRRIVVSLLAGLFVGALILAGGDPLTAAQELAQRHLWGTVIREDKLQIFAFTCLMGAMVGIISRSGGMRGLVAVATRWAGSQRRAQVTAWLLGLFVFFDDYANTMLLGNTLRPLFDRLRISREKLAYVVDSTAAPVSGLALVSTWVASEIAYVQEGLDKLGTTDVSAFDVFLRSIPYRFYVLWALCFVPIVAWMKRDFPAMARAERRARKGAPLPGSAAAQPQPDHTQPDHTQPEAHVPPRWYNAVLPIVVTVAAITWFLYQSGVESLVAEQPERAASWGAIWAAEDATAGEKLAAWGALLRDVFGSADSYGALLWGALLGVLAAVLLVLGQRLLPVDTITAAATAGARTMVPALVILWFASAMSLMTGNKPDRADALAAEHQAATEAARAAERELMAAQLQLAPGQLAALPPVPAESGGASTGNNYPLRSYRLYTGEFLGDLLEDRLAAPWVPAIIFVLASLVAFSTGTSWGTMGVIMPLVIPLVARILGPTVDLADSPVFVGAIGGVLAGAIFGDHCSPISDTTVMSSQSSGCDHMAHVATQLPYALVIGGLSVGGALLVGFQVPVWLVVPLGIAASIVCLRLWGEPTD